MAKMGSLQKSEIEYVRASIQLERTVGKRGDERLGSLPREIGQPLACYSEEFSAE
jgi:hypothetical protein